MRPYPVSYIAYLVHFHATRDYFECHELLEEYWKEHPGDGLADLWVGLIQLAVGQYHERRGNFRGAGSLYRKSLSKLERVDVEAAGLARADLLRKLEERADAAGAENAEGYRDINLVVQDEKLKSLCLEECARLGVIWGTESTMVDESIIHRHKLRDRSGVIAARREALRARKE
ncbi:MULTISPECIES: DUF309 domain-containing protein [Paenibacillus]|uniref:DUF309 domain-containing protein n=1 Tax=Paenibacillus TaxID=44249 RepID=UPI00164DE850|nr:MULTISPECIES: DUF309 domain-containing protein [Paenibacillus]QNK55256.1 DUF309 domain-containing protein [Paenibacillus sp. PAMC21692]